MIRIIINGKIASFNKLEQIDPNNIKAVDVLKDKASKGLLWYDSSMINEGNQCNVAFSSTQVIL